jgi:hypothetical protein
VSQTCMCSRTLLLAVMLATPGAASWAQVFSPVAVRFEIKSPHYSDVYQAKLAAIRDEMQKRVLRILGGRYDFIPWTEKKAPQTVVFRVVQRNGKNSTVHVGVFLESDSLHPALHRDFERVETFLEKGYRETDVIASDWSDLLTKILDDDENEDEFVKEILAKLEMRASFERNLEQRRIIMRFSHKVFETSKPPAEFTVILHKRGRGGVSEDAALDLFKCAGWGRNCACYVREARFRDLRANTPAAIDKLLRGLGPVSNGPIRLIKYTAPKVGAISVPGN